MPNQTIFEIIKDTEKKRKQIERAAHNADQLRAIKEKERQKVLMLVDMEKKLASLEGTDKEQAEAELLKVKAEIDRLKEMFKDISGDIGIFGRGPPANFFSSLTQAHTIYFCIKDK